MHQLKRKYAENKDKAEKNNSDGSSIEEELEFVDTQQESDDNDEDDNEICDRNGYYSPIDEEKDEWILKLQNQRKRKVSPYTKDGNTKRKSSSNRKIKTPVGKKLVRRKSTPTVTSSANPSASARKRSLTIQDSSDDDIF